MARVPYSAHYVAVPGVRRSDCVDQGNGRFAVKLAAGGFVSVQKDGTVEAEANVQGWETAHEVDGFVVYDDPAYPHPYILGKLV